MYSLWQICYTGSVNFLFRLSKPLLFSMDPERAHYLALDSLRLAFRFGMSGCARVGNPVQFCGIEFPNMIGLAAGFDKNADYIDALGSLGFGHVEVGTVTPRPQPGNDRPRLFRLPAHGAIINRMGFNNKGVDYLVTNMSKSKFTGVRGINIGKNFDTALEDAHKDYLTCFQKVYDYADYIVVNVSSPNTEGLRSLQGASELTQILEPLLNDREQKTRAGSLRKPL
ncbi:MAG: dihydroorotate dehydrogenase (quinone), partial [Bdellovibrionales bacterium]|nr:dihydroorotate dehydrogenase (quinone) [Bdellovibrionales bacterium]